MITASQLTKQFTSGGETVVAVDDISFEVDRGEVYGLLGPNGAGKTTSLRMVIGLLPPDSGYAEIDGVRTQESPNIVKSKIGLVTASDGLYPFLTVREILEFFGDLYAISPATIRENIDRLAQLLGLKTLLSRRAINLSTGQKQRVNLARALVHDPPVMLLDEPTRGLDVIGTQIVFEYIDHLRNEGKAVIVSTHRLDEAQRLCDRFGLLHEGRLRHEGTLQALREATGQESLVDMFRTFASAALDGTIGGIPVSGGVD